MKIIKNNDELKSLIDENNDIIINDSITCKFDIDVEANIKARNIHALNIKARNIHALNINAWDIVACDIDAYDINAWDINAWDINAWDIDAYDINAWDINARDISYYAVCFAYNNLNCNNIKGNRINSKHFVLDGKIIIKRECGEK